MKNKRKKMFANKIIANLQKKKLNKIEVEEEEGEQKQQHTTMNNTANFEEG